VERDWKDGVRILTLDDLERATDIFTRAFAGDALLDYLLGDRRSSEHMTRALHHLTLRTYIPLGIAYGIGEPLVGLAFMQRGRPKIPVRAALRNLAFMLWNLGIRPIIRMIRCDRESRRRRPPTDHAYLAGVCIDPEHWREGHGKRLVEGLVNRATWVGVREVWLETSTSENVPFYERCGFSAGPPYQPCGNGPLTWSMSRLFAPPSNAQCPVTSDQ
jgi:ribosomal protein S18 acetylase RimI-like enzyme